MYLYEYPLKKHKPQTEKRGFITPTRITLKNSFNPEGNSNKKGTTTFEMNRQKEEGHIDNGRTTFLYVHQPFFIPSNLLIPLRSILHTLSIRISCAKAAIQLGTVSGGVRR